VCPSSSDVEVQVVNEPLPERSSRRSLRRPANPGAGAGASDGNAPLRCLVTGGSGFLGRRLVSHLGCLGTAVGTYRSRPHPDLPMVQLDVTQKSQVDALVDEGGFDVCVHAAANRDVEACEDDPRAAVRLNVHATRFVAEACRRAGTRLVYISTDHVFDGLPGRTYDEDDEPRPIQVYGFTKLAGELEALRTPGALCIRAPVLHGAPADNEDDFPGQVLRRLRIGATIAADDAAARYPVLVDELADAVARLCSGAVAGIVHFSSAEGVTKYAWARMLAEAFDLDPACVIARPQAGRAARPRDNHLTSKRLAALGLTAPTNVSDAVRALRRAGQAV
jgi:dTDP-4-dehydrorhamnose reductase